MPEIYPVDEFLTQEWYPGFTPDLIDAPFVAEPARRFSKDDESRFWFLDFHWPRGMVPMGMLWPMDGYTWATQWAAQLLPLPPTNGLAMRMAATHIYGGEVPVDSAWNIGYRAKRMQQNLGPFLENFDAIWAQRVEELEYGLGHFESYALDGLALPELGRHLVDARTFQKRAFEIHFEMMYPLLANYVGFYGVCGDLGIEPGEISKFLQGYDTKILETDRGLWTLTTKARDVGLAPLFAQTEPEGLYGALSRAGGAAVDWLAAFDAFIATYGWRCEGIFDVMLAPWVEDPTSPLGTIRTFLAKGNDHDFQSARNRSIAEREAAIEAARSGLSHDDTGVFNAALASCRKANFAWWNDEHNYYLDLRVAIPIRRACLAISTAVEAERKDDTLFLFWPEMMALVRGERRWTDFRAIVRDRRDYYEHWLAKRPQMPKVLGTVPDQVTDPIMIEIFGMHHHFFNAMKSGGRDVTTLVGVGASSGLARGPARVLHSAGELHRIAPGEILVCEATSPNWTPAFGKIAACVCDGGGTLTHASIISREYRIPCVVGVGLATTVIADGDIVEVDGSKGIVRVTKSAPAEPIGV